MPAQADPPKPDSSAHWRDRPLVTASFALHTTAVGIVAANPSQWPLSAGIVVANHLLLAATGLWPRSTSLGPNWRRLPSDRCSGRVALTIDDGPDPEVTPRVLDALDAGGARATFFCVGERLVRHAALGREIVARGHAIENHSQHHANHFSVLGPRRMRTEVASAQESIAGVTGERPRFFRAPAGLRNPFLDPILCALDLRLVSWTRRGFDTVSRRADVVANRLTRGLAAGDIVLLHDGNAAHTAAGEPVILAALPRVLAAFRGAGLSTVTLREALP